MADVPETRGGSGASSQQPSLPGRMSPFASLHREIDRLFDEFSGGRRWFQWGQEPHGAMIESPAVDVAETEDGYEITVEIAGVEPKDIEISASDGMLSIKGEKSSTREEKKKRYHLSERRYGAFQRSFALPPGVDVEQIQANQKDGLLKITLPKTQAAKSQQRKIEIQAK